MKVNLIIFYFFKFEIYDLILECDVIFYGKGCKFFCYYLYYMYGDVCVLVCNYCFKDDCNNLMVCRKYFNLVFY